MALLSQEDRRRQRLLEDRRGAGVGYGTPWPEVLYILSNSSDKLRQQAILEKWPEVRNPPNRTTLLRWLTRATRQSLIRRAGSRHKDDAFRCCLAEREPLLWPGDRASFEEKEAWR